MRSTLAHYRLGYRSSLPLLALSLVIGALLVAQWIIFDYPGDWVVGAIGIGTVVGALLQLQHLRRERTSRGAQHPQ